jgi:hypothetical protein
MINLNLSAWEQIHRRFDYNRTPFAPSGIKVLIHKPPDKRGTWSDHAIEGWYVGPVFNHYSQHTMYCKKLGGQQTTRTLTWLPYQITMPIATPQDMVYAAIQDLTVALYHPQQGRLAQHLKLSAAEKLQELTELFTNNNNTASQDPLDNRHVTITPKTHIQTTSTTKRNTQQIPKHPNQLRAAEENYCQNYWEPRRVDEEDEEDNEQDPGSYLRVEIKQSYQECQSTRATKKPTLFNPQKGYLAITNQENDHFATSIWQLEAKLEPTPKGFTYKAVNPDSGELNKYTKLAKAQADHCGSQQCAMTMDLSIKDYVQKALQHFEHDKPKRPQHVPSKWTAPQYSATIQMAEPEDHLYSWTKLA